jgi:hypothetical protein
MSNTRLSTPWDFFHDASIAALESYELSRLNSSANLRRQIAALLDQWVDDNSHALLAHWVRDQRTRLNRTSRIPPSSDSPPQTVLPFDHPATPEPMPHRQVRLPKLARGHHR